MLRRNNNKKNKMRSEPIREPELALQERDYRALRLTIERAQGSALAKSRLLRRLDKNWRRGRVNMAAGGPEWRWRLCNARLMLGDFSNWEGWEYRSEWATRLWQDEPFRFAPMWRGEPTWRLLVIAEQGVGDEVMFMSLLPEALVRCGYNVCVECDERLRSAIERSFANSAGKTVQTVARLKTIPAIEDWARDKDFTAWIAMADLARYFRRELRHFPGKPYLKPDPARVAELERFRHRVGVSWSGNHGRYEPKDLIAAIGETPVNLQYDGASELAEDPGIDLKADLEGVFALCSVLARVVSVSTSVAHIAAAIGTPVELVHAPLDSGGLNSSDTLNWKWGLGGRTPWYGSARVYQNLNAYRNR